VYPVQRITRYPLLLRQVLNYTEPGQEQTQVKTALDVVEKILEQVNEAIRDNEGRETLKSISQHLWIGTGYVYFIIGFPRLIDTLSRLDLTAPTRNMGPRKLLKEGILLKSKSGRKLHAYLCSDILVLTDISMKNLYRMVR
jgi:actin cytoskeleton-regulatory complex protein PAN1